MFLYKNTNHFFQKTDSLNNNTGSCFKNKSCIK